MRSLTEVCVAIIDGEPTHGIPLATREVARISDQVRVPAVDITSKGLRLRKAFPDL